MDTIPTSEITEWILALESYANGSKEHGECETCEQALDIYTDMALLEMEQIIQVEEFLKQEFQDGPPW